MNVQIPKFTITRKQAADLLDVSTRTIDRYIRNKKLSARKKGGNILLSEEELNNLKVSLFQNMHGASPDVPGRAHRHVDSVALIQPFAFDERLVHLTGLYMLLGTMLLFYFMQSGRILKKREGIFLFVFYIVFVFTEFITSAA